MYLPPYVALGMMSISKSIISYVLIKLHSDLITTVKYVLIKGNFIYTF